ncbi:hypothetical protein GmHk_05G013173 [Glycine max]|nr:hypothetical protein GmHk_05G013173 [Glycine max]
MQTLGLLVALILGFYQKFLYFSLRFLLLMLMDFLSKFKFFTQASELGCYALFFSSPTTRNHLSSKDNNSKEEEHLREESMEDEVFNEDSEKGATTVQRNVIESLWWIVVQVESHKKLLEHQLGFLRERLRQFINDQEIQQLQEEQELILG